ncbi:unnamed protein product [Rotaria sordida]|uniref:F-box domain-containing protein n=1 Tax=Rotaria sordida TaxID=392033 RepID=A0A819J4I8_9BILA|nr:unnamed protein product [Rotaria sordida]CAF0937558.1 unnamed protein product [Rotaria sordida]CAF0953269.1 unnamed protein product [Rotaria sordida]CAF1074325.1 unnamed protein product [Rotaria sordida]CAF1260218.1 unnamed protein product [Rotaria sordida]
MSRSNVHLLDLPNEILLIILRRLNNIDVLYSLLDINNERLGILAQEKTFTNILNFVYIDNISVIDRFCIDILPKIHHNVKYFILEPIFMERILLATVYPNLTELKLFNFEQQIALNFFTNESSLRSVFQQITNLILINNDKSESISSLKDYTRNDKLPNMKCFSLKSFFRFRQLDQILSLLRRMSYLENLTLYLLIEGRNRIVDGTCVQNDILVYMPQLHSFTFYISTYIDTRDLSRKDIQQTLINIGRQNATSIVNYISVYTVVCSIVSLPFTFDYLVSLGNIFPNIVFSYVTYLQVQDFDAFRHEFFVRIARSFPLLKYLRIFNIESQLLADLLTFSSDHSQSYSMVEYPHLTSLDVAYSHKDYLEQFLNETKAYVPCLTELTVCHRHLKIVTENFTREATRRNCTQVKQLIIIQPLDHSEDHSHYFPSL